VIIGISAPCFYSRWLGKCAIDAPPQGKSFLDDAAIESLDLVPVGNTMRLAIEGYVAVLSGISLLLMRGCPTTVCWFVIAFVVYAIDGVRGSGRASHVTEKRLKAIHPSFTNSNTVQAVFAIARVVGIRASRNHSRPASIGRSARHPMCDSCCSVSLSPKASAALRLPVHERVGGNFFDGSALTSTNYVGVVPPHARIADRCPSMNLGTNWDRVCDSHSQPFLNKGGFWSEPRLGRNPMRGSLRHYSTKGAVLS
jgi:hypothetical protein